MCEGVTLSVGVCVCVSLSKCLHASDRGGSNRERERERKKVAKRREEGKEGQRNMGEGDRVNGEGFTC